MLFSLICDESFQDNIHTPSAKEHPPFSFSKVASQQRPKETRNNTMKMSKRWFAPSSKEGLGTNINLKMERYVSVHLLIFPFFIHLSSWERKLRNHWEAIVWKFPAHQNRTKRVQIVCYRIQPNLKSQNL